MARLDCGFFGSTDTDVRSYSAADLAGALAGMTGNGVSSLNDLQVTATGNDGMKIAVGFGTCFINGYCARLINDGGGALQFTLSPSGSAPRYDRIVARLNLSTEARNIILTVKEGAAASSPKKPDLIRNSAVYEISLAAVLVSAGTASIVQNSITDERSDAELCGLAGSRSVAPHAHSAATATTAGFMPAADKKYMDALKGRVTVGDGLIDLGGAYIDNALFR